MIPMIDWLSVTVDIKDYDRAIMPIKEKLEDHKILAQELRAEYKTDHVIINLFGQYFEVKHVGAASYAYILHNDQMELRLAKGRSGNSQTFPIYVHFKSEYLWSYGPEKCWIWFKDWLSNNLGNVIADKINRIDLCCHTDKAINYNPINYRGKYSDTDLRTTHRKEIGINFGSRKNGAVYARIYNKSLEIEKSKKYWFKEIWKNNNMNLEEIVNIEFELKRPFFNEAEIKKKKIDNCQNIFSNLCSLWDYCTCEWLVMIEGDYKRAERAKTDPVWEDIQAAFACYKGTGQIERKKQKQCKIENILPPLFGYLTSYAAYNNITDINEAIDLMAKEGLYSYCRKGKNIREIISGKIALIDGLMSPENLIVGFTEIKKLQKDLTDEMKRKILNS